MLVVGDLRALTLEHGLEIGVVLLREGAFDVKLVRGEDLNGPLLVFLRRVHHTVSLLEVKLLCGENSFHQRDEARLTCVARPVEPDKPLLLVFSLEEHIVACGENFLVPGLGYHFQTLLAADVHRVVREKVCHCLFDRELDLVSLIEVPYVSL